jgi:hypothetical protein
VFLFVPFLPLAVARKDFGFKKIARDIAGQGSILRTHGRDAIHPCGLGHVLSVGNLTYLFDTRFGRSHPRPACDGRVDVILRYDTKMTDWQVGRNADLFARAIANLATKEERYPYLRILISIVEQAHPEWNQAPHKDRQIANAASIMSQGLLDRDEVAEVVRVRDEERGYFYE